ncbi:aminopeptidase P family protein [Vibrio sp. SM6]|uniref:Aminopeptidase P family protein n=1 Tax=Vibrio agarilyticus TaxID=2726741 RepID=A0A7X8TU12_9VIBR|nr:aminopeptidase P family protein [Vibrio agarilyticus]NLS14794.1 aminopeptidase P family protein [Vibrio agarilyticus]
MHETINHRIAAIRKWMEQQNIDAFYLPHEDEFLGEYVPAHNERLAWLTGFTGSAGAAVITQTQAAMFVDGRYTVQVTKQVPNTLFEYRHLIEEPALEWIKQHVTLGAKVALDPRMHSCAWLEQAQERLAGQYTLTLLNDNPIDALWQDRPQPLGSMARLMPLSSVGQSSESKRIEIGRAIANLGADSAVITALDSICWLLNIRGLDVPRLPVLLSHALLHKNGDVDFFIEADRLPAEFAEHAGPGVRVMAPEQLSVQLQKLTNTHVLLDPNGSSAWFKLTLQNAGALVIASADPCLMPKATKNEVEIAGMKACHITDGVAMVKFLSWLDNEVAHNRLHDEATLADTLETFRRQDEALVDLSFDTISAAGSNAAMCHYNHINQAVPGQLALNTLYLVDSGGQYTNGTTDITRTIAIGEPTAAMKTQFTLALKGHIGIATARFPKGTRGYQLDTLARQHLWAQGYDYDHGTGHGVGHFLSVHEGPASISKRQIDVPLAKGMVLSNEPGYYRADHFGIRIENLELVVEKETLGDFPILTFESLTRCPIDKRNVVVDLLSTDEVQWLNDYHQLVWSSLEHLVEGDTKAWLREATLPL